MIRVSVYYKTRPDAWFDFDYYIKHHLPLCQTRLKDYGLLSVNAVKGISSPKEGEAAFVCIAYFDFENIEGLQEGMGTHGAEILGDHSNYTNIEYYDQISETIYDSNDM